MATSLYFLLCTIAVGYGYKWKQELCSGIDISNESNLRLENIVNKLWYSHLMIDDTKALQTDGKLILKLERGGRTAKEFFVGRSLKTGECAITEFRDTPKRRNRPCLVTQQLRPVPEPGREYIYTTLDYANTQLLLVDCLEFDRNQQRKCTKLKAIAFTTRPKFLKGERRLFENKIIEFGADTSRIQIQRSSSNRCEDPVLRRLGLLRRQRKHRPRKHYRY